MEGEVSAEATEGIADTNKVKKEDAEGKVADEESKHVEGEFIEDEHVENEHEEEYVDGEHVEGEQVAEEHIEKEQVKDEQKEVLGEGEGSLGEELEGEHVEGEEVQDEEKKEEQKPADEEVVEEEEGYVEEPPPDPTAPFNFSDSKEALKEPFELRPDQLAEVEQLWEVYQNYTPAYTDIDNYITEKELFYMLKALMLMTVTEEQFYELIAYCVKPPHPKGHINFEQFVKMVTLRQRDFPIEDELRSALQVFDPDRTGSVDRDNLKEVLAKQGHKMPQKQLDNLIKEVDMSNDGTLGIEDIVGTMCIDLNPEDLMMLRASLYPPEEAPTEAEETA